MAAMQSVVLSNPHCLSNVIGNAVKVTGAWTDKKLSFSPSILKFPPNRTITCRSSTSVAPVKHHVMLCQRLPKALAHVNP
jgi:hypothetical protein